MTVSKAHHIYFCFQNSYMACGHTHTHTTFHGAPLHILWVSTGGSDAHRVLCDFVKPRMCPLSRWRMALLKLFLAAMLCDWRRPSIIDHHWAIIAKDCCAVGYRATKNKHSSLFDSGDCGTSSSERSTSNEFSSWSCCRRGSWWMKWREVW